ncbi:MAG: hypothetical protein HYY00_01855 [Chloroflexi bacterium]|nr:hypothetical protein [Chloroflexota bacterium]
MVAQEEVYRAATGRRLVSLMGGGGLQGQDARTSLALNGHRPDGQHSADHQQLNDSPRPEAEVKSAAGVREGAVVDRIAQELGDVRADIRAAIAEAKTRLLGVIQEEIRRAFDDAFSNAGETRSAGALNTDQEETLQFVQAAFQEPHPRGPESESQDGPSSALAVRDGLLGRVDGDVYEGVVRLSLDVGTHTGLVAQLVATLSKRPQLRILRVEAQREGGVEVLVWVLAPTCLEQELRGVECVARVSVPAEPDPEDDRPLLMVWLIPTPALT